MTTPAGPDVSCRVAWTEDAEAIAAVQTRAWRERYGDAVPPDFAIDAEQWRTALARPGDARNRVLVALAHDRVDGFAVCTPAADPDLDPIADGELSEFTVDAERRGAGHGSRLLQSVAETLVADRFTRAVTWVDASDDALRGFLTSAGWGPDGAHRELAAPDGGALKQVRLHTALTDVEPTG